LNVEKLFNKRFHKLEFDEEVQRINRKTIAITLVMLATLSAVIGVLTMTALAQDSTTTNAPKAASDTTQSINYNQYTANTVMTDNGGFADNYGISSGLGVNSIKLSSEYAANVISILNNDSDVLQNLISQGYNVTSINPTVQNVIEGNGTIAKQVTTATVIMQNGILLRNR
jgi:uncharacterized membrane protein YfhO